ncbi:MAG: Smr/MutS family protein, partial [Chloroflexi bacterium]|nr:Smr/MutS family protein [Chloroflexota bacterium]
AAARVGAAAQLRGRARPPMWWEPPGGEPVDYDAIKRARLELEQARAEVEKLEQGTEKVPEEPPRPVRLGDIVRIRGLNVQGAVQSMDSENQEATVIVGDARFTLDVSRLTPVEEGTSLEEPQPARSINYDLEPVVMSNELHIRGMRADEAAVSVEEFLDRALRNGADSVRIVHGKGRGVLRQSVQETLDRNSLVKSYRYADHRDGGIGVTVVELT